MSSTVNKEIETMLLQKGVTIIRFADLSPLYADMAFTHIQSLDHVFHPKKASAQRFPRAVLLGMALSPDFILAIHRNLPDTNDEYLEKEGLVELLAEELAGRIQELGYRAYAQSEANNLRAGYIEQKYIRPEITCGISPIPQKAIARISGLGFIGKNNLLVTKEYGCAIALCSVLTDAPLVTSLDPIIEENCGSCSRCIDICAGSALLGEHWSVQKGRDSMVDVSKCCCPLLCMMVCPWTLRYANSSENQHR